MTKSILCLLLLLLLSNVYSQHEESDIEKLKGTWRVFTEEEDPFHGIMDNVLASPVLEIVDASTCQLTFLERKRWET